MKEINDYLSKADKEIANNVIYRVYGMPGPIFMEEENSNTPTPEPDPKPSLNIPFYVENITQETETLTVSGYDSSGSGYLEFPVDYSIDGINWDSLGTTGETSLTRSLAPGDKLYLRASTNYWREYQPNPSYINCGCTIFGVSKVGGNIMSLLYGNTFTGNETIFPSGSTHNFSGIFQDNTNLINTSELLLPATTLAQGCYESMFQNCTSLTTAPKLPATTLAQECYKSMFFDCISLTQAPALPATILAEGCYSNMFNSCTSLTTVHELPATTLAQECYKSMFQNCTSLTTAPSLPATELANRCYDSMFQGCTSLTTAPALPATTLVQGCYASMFNSCTSLTAAPELPATTLAEACYDSMFQNCTNLNYIKCLAMDISADSSTSYWVNGVAETGTFIKDPSMTSWDTGDNGIPSGWTVESDNNVELK